MTTPQPLPLLPISKRKTPFASVRRAWDSLSHLNLWIAFGSVAVSHYFSFLWGVDVSPEGFACLGLAVFALYNLDHLIDAKNLPPGAKNPRRGTHQNHPLPLSITAILSLFSALVLAFLYLDSSVWAFGLVLGFLALLHIWFSNRIHRYPKEAMVALVYTGGVLGLPFLGALEQSVRFSSPLYPGFLVSALFLCAYANLATNSLLDREEDIQEGFASLATVSSDQKPLVWQIWILSTLGLGLAGSSLLVWSPGSHRLEAISPWTLVFLLPPFTLLFHNLGDRNRFRLIGDISYLAFGVFFVLS